MSETTIGLVVHAVNLPAERERLRESLDELGPIMRRVRVEITTEADYGEGDPVKFNADRARNIGIRRCLDAGCVGVVCIDADYIIPPGIFELCLEPHMQPYHLWIRRRDITIPEARPRRWREWLEKPVFQDCWGSCNYLSAANWRKVGGWDERTYGWGGDDDILHIRIGQAQIERRRIDSFALMHLAHPPRVWVTQGYRGTENMKFAQQPQPNYLA